MKWSASSTSWTSRHKRRWTSIQAAWWWWWCMVATSSRYEKIKRATHYQSWSQRLSSKVEFYLMIMNCSINFRTILKLRDLFQHTLRSSYAYKLDAIWMRIMINKFFGISMDWMGLFMTDWPYNQYGHLIKTKIWHWWLNAAWRLKEHQGRLWTQVWSWWQTFFKQDRKQGCWCADNRDWI